MSVEILENGLQCIARTLCPCICCRSHVDIARTTLDAHAHQQLVVHVLNPSEVVLTDAAEGRPLFHHPV